MKRLRYKFEGLLVYLFIGLFRHLPLDAASALGGFIGRSVGRFVPINGYAITNLRMALPGKSSREYNEILNKMWDNLGRIFAEYPHLEEIARDRIKTMGEEFLQPLIESDNPCIIFTGHLANWEILGARARHIGIKNLDLIYRVPNNPYVDKELQRCRDMDGKLVFYPKSLQGMRDVVAALKKGRRIGMLIDQKYNQGIAAKFFGRDAMTSPAFAQLAQKFDCPLHPARVERLTGANFRITVYPAMETQDRKVEDIIDEAHAMFENWIRERPEQWLWLHRRWGKI